MAGVPAIVVGLCAQSRHLVEAFITHTGVAQSGEGGMLDWLGRLPATTRKLLIHINNTNPILDEASPERRAVEAAGVEVSFDGLEIAF